MTYGDREPELMYDPAVNVDYLDRIVPGNMFVSAPAVIHIDQDGLTIEGQINAFSQEVQRIMDQIDGYRTRYQCAPIEAAQPQEREDLPEDWSSPELDAFLMGFRHREYC